MARQHLFEAIARLGQALAERAPLVIFIDDWHWADAASLDVLHYAALRWREARAPILVLLTLRQEALTELPELPAWLARLRHDVGGAQLALAALSRAETEQLIQALLEPAAARRQRHPLSEDQHAQLTRFSRWLFEQTDGQPFFLVETLKALVESSLMQPDPATAAWRVDWTRFDQQGLGSGAHVLPGVRELIRAWLARLSPPAAELLAAAAVLGQQVSFDRLGRVAGLPESQALTALDELLARQLLLEAAETPAGGDPGYRFAHQKLGEVVYAEAGAARRRILHRRAFEALQAGEAQAAELAHHALKAGLTAESIQYSIAAGNAAMRLFAAQVAIAHYETAWQLAEQKAWPAAVSGADGQDLYAGLGRAYELTEAWAKAASTYQAMIDHARSIGAAAMEGQGLNRLATVYINGIKQPQAAALLEQARALAEQSGDRRGLAETEWNLSHGGAHGPGPGAGAGARRAGAGDCPRAEAPAVAGALPERAGVCARPPAPVGHAGGVCQRSAALYARAGSRVLEVDSQRLDGWSQMYRGQPQASRATLREALAFSQQIENLWGETECAWRLAGTELELGHLGGAARLAAGRPAGAPGGPADHGGAGAVHLGPGAAPSDAAWGRRGLTLEDTAGRSHREGPDRFGDWALEELCAVTRPRASGAGARLRAAGAGLSHRAGRAAHRVERLDRD